MRLIVFACVLLLASCGAPSEPETPEASSETQQSGSATERATTQPVDVPEGNVNIAKQEFSECQFEFEVETAPYLRYSNFENGIAGYQLGFWANCCGDKEVVGQLEGNTLTLLLVQSGKECRCN